MFRVQLVVWHHLEALLDRIRARIHKKIFKMPPPKKAMKVGRLVEYTHLISKILTSIERDNPNS